MKALQVADVLDLAAAESSDAEDRLQKVFEWDFERTMTSARLLFAAAGSVIAVMLAALLRVDSVLTAWHVFVFTASSAVLAISGMVILWRIRKLHREFLAALQLLNSAKRLGPLLARYRGSQ